MGVVPIKARSLWQWGWDEEVPGLMSGAGGRASGVPGLMSRGRAWDGTDRMTDTHD